jgi:hypothetical protein
MAIACHLWQVTAMNSRGIQGFAVIPRRCGYSQPNSQKSYEIAFNSKIITQPSKNRAANACKNTQIFRPHPCFHSDSLAPTVWKPASFFPKPVTRESTRPIICAGGLGAQPACLQPCYVKNALGGGSEIFFSKFISSIVPYHDPIHSA